VNKILVIAEHDGKKLNSSTAKTVSCAAFIEGAIIDLIIFSSDTSSLASEASKLNSISRVLTCEHETYDHSIAANIAPQIVNLAKDYSHIFGPSTTFGKDLMPRVAALLNVNQISDIMSVESSHIFKRPTYAGNAIATVEAPNGHIVVATVRIASFKATSSENSVPTENIEPPVESSASNQTRFIKTVSNNSDRPDLQTAARVVSGGRALASSENFEIIYNLANKLGAAIGASRAAVDAGYAPNELQVGQTGKIIAPNLYIAIGISGAIQHLTGIKDAGTIVAINSDQEAPIFEVADIGLVADLFVALPELMDAIN
tara:strand:+ start:406 stop:1353 length:948 start_codon:yes stop_codon:yes gene_type:complete